MNPYAPPNARVCDLPHDDRPSLLVTHLLALIFGILALGWCGNLLYQRAALPFAMAVLCGMASLGLWRARPWSRWVVYLFSTLLCSYFAWYVAALAQDGWPYESTARSVASLLPASLWVLFGVAAAVYVARVFRK
jgi:hypothetical protein